MEIYDWYIDIESIDSDDCCNSHRIIQFEIENQNPGLDFEYLEIIQIHSMPDDCTHEELYQAIWGYHELYLTDMPIYFESAMQRLMK